MGWLVNDRLTCIPGTTTFWHDLLEWIPGLEDKTGGYTDFSYLADRIESYISIPDYIIRNASYFRRIDKDCPQISLLQDIRLGDQMQLDVCNNSTVTVVNSQYTLDSYKGNLKSRIEVIPLGVDFDFFQPLDKKTCREELGIPEDCILFIGDSGNWPKGFDIVKSLIEETYFNFCLVMKDDYQSSYGDRVKVFNKVDHNLLLKIINACEVLICTSQIETQHLAGIEAAACNVPILSTDVGIYHELRWKVGWGGVTQDFKKDLSLLLGRKDLYNPRQVFLDCGLDKYSCRRKWFNLINEVKSK